VGRRLLWILVLVAGCRIGFEAHIAGSDAESIDDDGPGDASRDAGPVDGSGDADLDDGGGVDGPPSLCGAAYMTLPGVSGTYRIVSVQQTWLAAEAACEADGAHLAVIDSSDENDAIQASSSSSPWIGTTDRITEATFLVVTGGGTVFANWAGSPPANTGEDCATLQTLDGTWDDEDCNTTRQSICECDGLPVVPGTF